MNTHLLTNAQIVTPAGHFTGSLSIENGIITGIHKEKIYKKGIDLHGQWLIPGCIDIHTDYLEKELHPRSSASFPLPFALHFLDARAAACGITTVFSAISFSDNEGKDRSFGDAIHLARQIDETRQSLLVRHFLQARINHNTDQVLDHLEEMTSLESLYMVVFNENIPGERILTAFKDKCIIGSHDDTSIRHVLEAAAAGSTLSEMPTTLAAARKAKELNMWVCMGAPNYFRGGSHCGNLSCREAMDEDLVDILCSDYHFPTMMASVIRLIDEGMSPSKAVNMVSLNPARLLKFDGETGSIELGKRADLVAFKSERSNASVSDVWVDGVHKFTANYMDPIHPLGAERRSEANNKQSV